MFKNLAKLGAGRRDMVPRAVLSHCNDNRPGRHLRAAMKPARPQRLACHWRAAVGGGLECHWQIESPDETSPGQSCTTRIGRRRAVNPDRRAMRNRHVMRNRYADGRTT